MSIGTLLVSLLIGGLLGYYSPFYRTQEIGDGIIFTGLVILLISIGAQLGGDDQILQNLNAIGGSALVLCVGSIIGEYHVCLPAHHDHVDCRSAIRLVR